MIRRDEFERVAMPHTESLLRAALRIARERAAAEDMVQETLLSAYAERFQQELPQGSSKARSGPTQWARTVQSDSHARETTAIDRSRSLVGA
ncbi:MAG: hypothetical protein DMF76_27185 [Acidobacteria bacterium]|nr:MAG: hypothetical protein DMF76_27185 [Acidobacteriota bacterium]